MAGGIETLLAKAKQAIVGTCALQTGDFLLASGRRSHYYLDSKMFTLSPGGTELVGRLIFALLVDTDVKAVGGMAHAGIPIVAMVTNISYREGHPLPGFYVREEQKGHGTRKIIEGHLPTRKGDKVAVVDDVVTTGGSVRKAISRVEAEGYQVAKVITLLERHEGGAEDLRREYDFVSLFTTDELGNLYTNYPGYAEPKEGSLPRIPAGAPSGIRTRDLHLLFHGDDVPS